MSKSHSHTHTHTHTCRGDAGSKSPGSHPHTPPSALVASWASFKRSLLPAPSHAHCRLSHIIFVHASTVIQTKQLYQYQYYNNALSIPYLWWEESRKEIDLHKISMYRGIQSFWFVSTSGSTDHSTWSVWGAFLRWTWWGSETTCGQSHWVMKVRDSSWTARFESFLSLTCSMTCANLLNLPKSPFSLL